MKKNYVLDTNILIHDPQSILNFQDNNLYIPIYVIEELDKLKTEQTVRGKSSREACRIIDGLRCQGNLSTGVPVGEGLLFIYVPTERKQIKVALDNNSMDNAILQSALDIKENSELRTILVTMDVNLRIRAESLGIQTSPYESQAIDPSKLNDGHVKLEVDFGSINKLFQDKQLKVEEDLIANACVTLVEPCGKTSLGRYNKAERTIRPLSFPRDGLFGISPKNKEQQFALDLLMDDSVKLVSLVGMAGTGKTILSVAAGLSKVLDGGYSRMLISRPIMPLGKDIGFLPGDIKAKLDPWMQPIYDNLELLMMMGGKKKTTLKYDDLFKQNLIKIEPLTYIRGRSIPNQFILLDEAQNLSGHELKTIITRCGEGTKIVLTGDPDQIDSPYMDQSNCGLNIAIDKMKDNPLVGHLILKKGERSSLANLAAKLM
jgi:PhoH-like ATPase